MTIEPRIILAITLLGFTSTALARGGSGDGGGLIAIGLAAALGWIASKVVHPVVGFFVAIAVYFIAAVYIKYIAAALGVALIAWFVHSLIFSKDK